MSEPDRLPPVLASTGRDAGVGFPTLTPAQMSRIAAHGRRTKTARGDVLLQAGERAAPIFVVVSGQLHVVPSLGADTIIAIYSAGQFSGEANMISGRPAIAPIRVAEPGEVIRIDRDHLLAIIQTDPELSEILMGAFIQRRRGLIAASQGDVLIVGAAHNAATLRVKAFLTRNGHPFDYIDLDRAGGASELLDRLHVRAEDIPVVVCRGQTALRNPTNAQIAQGIGLNEELDGGAADLVVVGGGPSGLAAAVYGASEGLHVLVLESNVPGGQAGSSSRIENYLGFPTGISGQELTTRACVQALKFGARVVVARAATRLICSRDGYAVEVDCGSRVSARAVIIATGAEYRRLALGNLPAFEGSGVYYAATSVEAQLCGEEDVVVVGGGNSAGQAGVFLSSTVRRVHMLVRGPRLADTMSQYLVRRIEDNPAIVVHTNTRVTGLAGRAALERVCWRDDRTGETACHDIGHVFVMTGASPNTSWLHGCVALDEQGFVKTGPALTPADLARGMWNAPRHPLLLETNRPGIFAVGDVRGGNIKRVASAVGEGAIAVALVHQVLRERTVESARSAGHP